MTNKQPMENELLNSQEAAAYLGTTPATLATWRCTKAVEIPYVRIGGSIRYSKSALDRFITENQV